MFSICSLCLPPSFTALRMCCHSVGHLRLRYDSNGDGSINEREFADALEVLGIDLEPDEFDACYSKLDPTGKGEVNYADFVCTCVHFAAPNVYGN